ncbi:ATPase [candidate division WOR-3 bacterium]|nr:ATPase [candidate division WOR-3 bacterium]
MNSFKVKIERLKTLNTGLRVAALILVLLGIIVLVTPFSLFGAEEEVSQVVGEKATAWAFLAAGFSIAVAVLGAGIALSKIGPAAMAALAEKPEIMGTAILFAGLAEGLAIWGLIVAILILVKV